MLEHYIILEQMRHKGMFEYKILVDEELYHTDIKIPPLLTQPYVENAIIHGFKGIDYKGILEISYKLKESTLQVEVRDNGWGLSSQDRPHKRKSLGSSITAKRLELINNSADVHVKYLIPESGQGTIIELMIPLTRTA